LIRPLSVTPPNTDRASPSVNQNAWSGTSTATENALPVPFWQSAQWQT
jgi:hypothetical protein